MYLLHGKKNGNELPSTDGSNFLTYQMGIITLYCIPNIYKKTLLLEKTLRLNIYVVGTDGILYGASREG